MAFQPLYRSKQLLLVVASATTSLWAVQSVTCPVRKLTYLQVGNPHVGVSTKLSSPISICCVCLSTIFIALQSSFASASMHVSMEDNHECDSVWFVFAELCITVLSIAGESWNSTVCNVCCCNKHIVSILLFWICSPCRIQLSESFRKSWKASEWKS